jgi:hypothetical protein
LDHSLHQLRSGVGQDRFPKARAVKGLPAPQRGWDGALAPPRNLFDIEDFNVVEHAEMNGLMSGFVKVFHKRQGGFTQLPLACHRVAQLKQLQP